MSDDFDPCTLVQSDEKGEPTVHLRRSPEAEVEILTIDQAHALLDAYDNDYTEEVDAWWYALNDLVDGIR